MASNWCFRHRCVLGGFFWQSLFSSDHFASGNASSGDVPENVDNTNKSAFILVSMKHKG